MYTSLHISQRYDATYPVELEHGSERRSAGTDRAREARVDCST